MYVHFFILVTEVGLTNRYVFREQACVYYVHERLAVSKSTSLSHMKGGKELDLRSLPWLERTVSLKLAFKLYINLQYNYV